MELEVAHMTESPKAADGTLPAQDVPQRLSSAVTSVHASSDMAERLESSRSSQRFLRRDLFDDAEGLVVVGASLASVLDMQALPLAFSWAESTSTSTLHGALLWLLSISTAESSAAMPEQKLDDSMVVVVEDLLLV